VPPQEVFRRLIYKQGFADGPTGWAFAWLSGLSEWVLAREHRLAMKTDSTRQQRNPSRPIAPATDLALPSRTDRTTEPLLTKS
jgi:hypothetical protein